MDLRRPRERRDFAIWLDDVQRTALLSETRGSPRTVAPPLSLQKRLHISGLHRKTPHDFTRRVMQGGSDRRGGERVRCFRASTVCPYLQIVDQYDFNPRDVRHGWNRIAIPI